MSGQLEIGDIIHGWDLLINPMGSPYTIVSVTKTLAKTNDGHVFIRNITYDSTRPKNSEIEYVGEVTKKYSYGSRRFFVLKTTNNG